MLKKLIKDFSQLEKKLNLNFKNKNLLVQAFVHRSYLNENPKFQLEHNERLEFLGDAVLELAVTEYLFLKYKKPEGDLTSYRASVVKADILGETAKELKLEDFLLLSKGETKETGKARLFILANCFESLIGALYLDQGFKKCKDFIQKNLLKKKLSKIIEKGLYRDAKSYFQEKAQETFRVTPIYRVLEEKGPDHAKQFVIGVFLKDEMLAKGRGLSKQEAELEAAKNALKTKGW